MIERCGFMVTPPSKGKLLYHITHMDNLPSILENGLIPRQKLLKSGLCDFTDIADPEILSKRESYKNALSQYVLFHFYPKNPFDGAVCKKFGSENMAIITIYRDHYKQKEFFIIPSHPLDSDEPDIYPYDEGVERIRWDILDRTEGRDYHDPEIRKACMAECVMKYTIPPQEFAFIYVSNENAKNKIKQMRNSNLVKVQVNRRMFP